MLCKTIDRKHFILKCANKIAKNTYNRL